MSIDSHSIPHDFENKNVFRLESLDAPIYRIFPKKWLVASVKDKKLALRKPAEWDDPFENFLLKQKVVLGGQPVSIENFQQRLYGQCWSLTKESDAMWRIYSHDKDGVKVKSTARKLFNVLLAAQHESAALRYFIGKVEYCDQQAIIDFFTNPKKFKSLLLDGTAQGPVVALLIKRLEFEHEREVRLVFQCDETEFADDTKFFPMDPDLLFEEMEFDPRIDSTTLASWTNEFRALGYTNAIGQSMLYRLPITNPISLD